MNQRFVRIRFISHSNFATSQLKRPKIFFLSKEMVAVRYVGRWSIYRGADNSLARPEGNKLQRQKILSFTYPIYNHNWRYITTIYVFNKISIKRNIRTIKQYTSGSRSG